MQINITMPHQLETTSREKIETFLLEHSGYSTEYVEIELGETERSVPIYRITVARALSDMRLVLHPDELLIGRFHDNGRIDWYDPEKIRSMRRSLFAGSRQADDGYVRSQITRVTIAGRKMEKPPK
ncbi:MAG: hypothetical protein HGA38_02740 [Candidatus Moranbacteria bacterium]|nr:hypothetical protein [Candidatus Moranbacteria bacterium]